MQPPLQDFAVGYDIDRSVVEIQARTTSFTPNLISSLGWLTTTAETAKTSKHVIKNQHVKTHLSNVCIRKCAKHIYIYILYIYNYLTENTCFFSGKHVAYL